MGPGGGEGVGADAIFTLFSTAFLGNFFCFPQTFFKTSIYFVL